ncbi:NUDIX hydrolase [Pacificimonas flava]|uniref:GDP-mannose pyrophosphatase n=1 Tax=Pacificimonas flava TaxID=1234595 RepID=M2TBM4_9SPHN|nr:NUDIX hydrolase [Pacificimonas flava]EMD84024.1 ADP-ribose pyrophosphatase [Pacificimonas flava]MBB5281004.1 ADP-ribose pyrophosphatase [Pacificimonas flava]
MKETTRWRGRFIEAVTEESWEYVRRIGGAGAAVILAETDAGEIVLVEQYRVPLGRPCIELPAGIVGDEDTLEGAEVAARRELEEETGFRPAHMESLGDFVTSPGLTAESFTLFRASGLERTGSGGGVADEDIRVHLVPRSDLRDFLANARARGCAVDKLLALIP